MRIKIILYVIFYTYLSLIFIRNWKESIHLDFIFFNFDVSILIVFFVTVFMGFLLGFFFRRKKTSKLKKEIKEIKDVSKNEKEK